MRRRLTALLLCMSAPLAAPAAHALDAKEVFARTRDASFMVIVTGDDPNVVDVLSTGSAVLVAPGRFVTNCHVLQGGKSFVVSRREDKIVERVVLVNYMKGRDLCELDLAEMKPGFDKPVEVAPPDSLQVGATVFAIGSPRGMELTLSSGIVSGFRDASGGMKLIQTTAPISPGSSGGGLFDDQGRLVGITTLQRINSQNLNFAVPAQYIPSAGISAANLAKQRGATSVQATSAESAFERQERLRRQEQDTIATRLKQFENPQPSASAAAPAPPVTGAQPGAARRPATARLAPYQSAGDGGLAPRIYEQLLKKGELAGADDTTAVRKVYEVLILRDIASQMRWTEGGEQVAEFRVQLRRSGDVMFVLPLKPSGVERFDQEAQRAIGAASPLPVPQDNEAFEQMSEITLAVHAPPPPAAAAAKTPPKKKPK